MPMQNSANRDAALANNEETSTYNATTSTVADTTLYASKVATSKMKTLSYLYNNNNTAGANDKLTL